ncbi:hypothetical protein [Amnibacterium flavum]|uniref:Uncharacterized protein n=1 Tax=Amnibacterium flavum TaxID=2173173 RepID=A0A2V1HS05_9MICO|nr:hypothetical protein [Amnibacterium flavum]PVZ95111.1 hypothetical protein DDQ50_00840 [Amnibacterium flavum]
MTGERTRSISRAEMKRMLRAAEKAGRSVARRNQRLAVPVGPTTIAEQIPSIAAAAVAAAAADAAPTRRSHRSRPAPAVRQARPTRRRTEGRALIAAVALTAALAAVLSQADVSSTHAWFTAKQTTVGNTVGAAMVKVAGVGPDLDPSATVQVANILPLSPADAANPAKGSRLDLVVRNTGSVPINWSLSLKDLKTTAGTVDVASLTNVSYTVNGGTTWSTPVKLAALTAITGSNLAATGSTKVTVTFRFWFDKDVTNDAQGAKAEFTTLLEAIQTGAA